MADGIRRIACCRPCRQIDIRRHRRIRKIQRVRATNTTIQRINPRAGIEQVIPRSAQHTVIAVRTIDRVAMVRSDKAGDPREACRVRSIRRRSRIKMQRLRCPVAGKGQRIRTAPPNIGVIPSRRIEQITPRPASYTIASSCTGNRVAVVRANHLGEVTDRIGRKTSRCSRRQINRRCCRRIRKIQRVHATGSAIQRINTSCRKDKIITRTANNTIVTGCTCDRVTKIGSDNFCKVADRIRRITSRRSGR